MNSVYFYLTIFNICKILNKDLTQVLLYLISDTLLFMLLQMVF